MENNNSNQNTGSSLSILDKIISSQEDQEKEEFNPTDLLGQLLKKLNSKEEDVLKRRYGLSGNTEETLEVIGKKYDVTRERIRQIENLSIKKIKEDKDFNNIIKPAEHVLVKIINQNGGVIEEEHLLQQLFDFDQQASDQKAILFIISELLPSRFHKIEENNKYKKGWCLTTTSLNFFDEVINVVISLIDQKKAPVTFDVLFKLFENSEFYKTNSTKLNEKILESYLELSQSIARNPFSEYGLKSWGSIQPKRMNDKIYLVLKKEQKPLHFVEIANKITQIFKKKAYPPTVHNELILNDKYVLVGRGIYALREWGYQKGVVADVLIGLLQKKGIPLSKEELVTEALKQRMVKKNTIYLALTNKKRFTKLADGKYTLAV